jgi:molybdate transport system ATP-binding protein
MFPAFPFPLPCFPTIPIIPPMFSQQNVLVQSLHCDIWAKDAFGPSSWGLAFGPEPVLRDFSWTWKEGEVWAILGSNTSGKDALAYALVGQAVVRPRESVGCWVNTFIQDSRKGVVLSFEEAEKAIRYSLRFDESDFVEGGQHPGLTVEGFLGIDSSKPIQESAGRKGLDLSILWEELGLQAVRSRGLKYLSTGELRKVLLFKALREAPPLLVCEDLWEGLDTQSRQEVTRFFQALTERRNVLFLCDRKDQILPSVTHVLQLRDGTVASSFYFLASDGGAADSGTNNSPTDSVHENRLPSVEHSRRGEPLIRMKNLRVAYADHLVFDGFDFELYPGEHCFIQGPNGCGKSTLVKLITGDHPQGWGNEIMVAGIPRKIGERVQDVRMQTSLVSHELHRSFLSLEEISTLEVVLSGFFGTVGLYEPVGEEKIAEAKEALQICGLSGYENRLFRDLPWGVQRLVLAARAFVRRPPLMILDEPCTGLDDEHRRILLATLTRIAEEAKATGRPTILLVTHDPGERLSFLGVHLVFYPDGHHANGQPRYRWEVTRKSVREACLAQGGTIKTSYK